MTDLNRVNAEAIPAGRYVAMITGSEMKPVKDSARQSVELTIQITEGPHAGYCLREQLDPMHPAPLAKNVSRGRLGMICEAAGVPSIRDYTDPASYAALHNRLLVIDVQCSTCSVTGTTTNRIAGYSKHGAEEVATEPVPAGYYVAKIVESEVAPDGKVGLTFEIIEGPHAGRRLRERLAPNSRSLVIEEADRKTLYWICQSVGMPTIRDYADPASYAALHGRPLVIDVRRGEGNSIARYFKKR